MDNYDIAVIGGGGAGVRAALAVREKDPDLRIVLITKGRLGKSGVTSLSCSDRILLERIPFTEDGPCLE